MRHEEETMKSRSVSNLKEDGCHNFKYLWEMCDHNFEDETSLKKKKCNDRPEEQLHVRALCPQHRPRGGSRVL